VWVWARLAGVLVRDRSWASCGASIEFGSCICVGHLLSDERGVCFAARDGGNI